MAPAMNTRTDELFRYRELAHQKARILRSIVLRDLPRLAAATGSAPENSDSQLQVEVTFRNDPEGDVWAVGTAAGRLSLVCQGCAERMDHPLAIEFAVCIVESDQRADELQDRDVMVVEGEGLSLVDLIEDELLLQLPERLCTEQPCERSLQLAYPAAADRPFQELESLKAALRSERGDAAEDASE